MDEEDDYVNDYAGDPQEGAAPASAAPATAAAPTTSAPEEPERGYDGDPDNSGDEYGEASTSSATSAPVLTHLYGLMGIENGQVDFDGELRPFESLTEEQRADVFQQQLDYVAETARQQAVADFGLTPEEENIINHFRNNGSLAGLESEQVLTIAGLSADDLHLSDIRGLLGENASEQQVQAALEARRLNPTFVAEAERIRNTLTQQADSQAIESEVTNWNVYATETNTALDNLQSVGKLAMTPEVRAYVKQQLTSREKPGTTAPFLAALNDPAKLAEYATKALLFDTMVGMFTGKQQQQRTKTIEEILGGGQGPTALGGAAPAGTRQAAAASGHKLTNEDIEQFG